VCVRAHERGYFGVGMDRDVCVGVRVRVCVCVCGYFSVCGGEWVKVWGRVGEGVGECVYSSL
jgi:hypothetical protein